MDVKSGVQDAKDDSQLVPVTPNGASWGRDEEVSYRQAAAETVTSTFSKDACLGWCLHGISMRVAF